MEFNWGDLRKRAEDATKPPPPGEYLVEVSKAEAKTASTSGFPMIAAQLKIVEGPSMGKTVFNNFNLTLDNDFAMGMFFTSMRAFGLDSTFFDANPSIDQVAATLVGLRVYAKLNTRVWNGQERPNVESIRPVDGATAVVRPASGPNTSGVPSMTSAVPSGPTPSTPSFNGPASPASPASPSTSTTPANIPAPAGEPALPF